MFLQLKMILVSIATQLMGLNAGLGLSERKTPLRDAQDARNKCLFDSDNAVVSEGSRAAPERTYRIGFVLQDQVGICDLVSEIEVYALNWCWFCVIQSHLCSWTRRDVLGSAMCLGFVSVVSCTDIVVFSGSVSDDDAGRATG